MSSEVVHGIYEALLDERLRDVLAQHPELRTVFGKIDLEEQPAKYAAFVSKVLEKALHDVSDAAVRLELCNRILSSIADQQGMVHLPKHMLVAAEKPVLLEITPPNYGAPGVPRPHTPLDESSLFTGAPREPQLAHELLQEMRSADGVDILISFIKWSGLRLLMPGFEDLRDRRVPVRLITTSYMGASDAPAVEWLARMPNVEVRVSYDTKCTRLHAKAYHFKRNTKYSTAYIGSANMSNAAITSGLEWNLKVTAQDLPHILEKFTIEFETYWHSHEFILFDPNQPAAFRAAIQHARNAGTAGPTVFFTLTPHEYQKRILEDLERERSIHGRYRNLVIAATGTGKTVVAAFDYQRFYEQNQRQARLLFVAHRHQILQQAQATFCSILRDRNFGRLLVGQQEADRLEHLFCSVGMLISRRLWERVGRDYYDFIVVDEVHHGTAASYRPIFENFAPKVLLGLTATPERMDGGNVAADFGNRFAAEIRLPEALDAKLLCPFHYFGVADPIALDQEGFWRNGKYDEKALENVYVFDRELANRRLQAILDALARYEPSLSTIKGISFCVTIRHAIFMAEEFTKRGIPSGAIVSGVDDADCQRLLSELRDGNLKFLFTVDKLSEGVDLPEVNMVLFLRPTESLTVFLQQLGRGLRHANEKDCLTVLDFVGQAHRRYRMDTKLKALMPRHRFAIDKEVELDFPHLPAGCSIQLDHLSRKYVLNNIRENIGRLAVQVPERIHTFEADSGEKLTFGSFVRYHDYEPEVLLLRETWSGWKAKARVCPVPADPDLQRLKSALVRAATITGPKEAARLREVLANISAGNIDNALQVAGDCVLLLYYRLWGDKASNCGIASLRDAFEKLGRNPTILGDLLEILAWSLDTTDVAGHVPDLSFPCTLELHAQYGTREIQAAFGQANLKTAGQTGVGVFHFPHVKAYAILITFQKSEREFSPTTMYADYPISRELLHWESQSTTSLNSPTGQNFIHHRERGYTVLAFARGIKNYNGMAVPFCYLGPADLESFDGERPIRIVWQLRFPMPANMFEDNRKG